MHLLEIFMFQPRDQSKTATKKPRPWMYYGRGFKALFERKPERILTEATELTEELLSTAAQFVMEPTEDELD